MANYVFENMSASDAASYQAGDYLIFSSTGASATNVTVTPRAASGLSTASVDLSYGGKTLTFPLTLSASSTMTPDHIIFNDGSFLQIGTTANETINSQSTTSGSTSTTAVVYGFDGSDSIVGGAGNDYLYGGTDTTPAGATVGMGGDTIVGGNGNNHIYGASNTAVQGTVDGNDSLTAGTGSNYINGNAGNDFISVGTTTSVGFNRVFGGAGSDTINVTGGLGSHAAVNGNAGVDTITDSGSGTNTLRGGQGNDTIIQSGASRDVMMGDAGDDTLQVSGASGHVAVLTGGVGADTFDFSVANSGLRTGINNTTGAGVAVGTTGSTTYYQEITDFTQGTDVIHLGTNNGTNPTIDHGSATVTFTSVNDAIVYAQQLLDNDATASNQKVAAVNVGNDAYLFYNDTATANAPINSIIKLDGVNQLNLTQTTASHTFG